MPHIQRTNDQSPKDGDQFTPDVLKKMKVEELEKVRMEMEKRLKQRGSSRPVTTGNNWFDSKKNERDYLNMVRDIISDKMMNEGKMNVKYFNQFILESAEEDYDNGTYKEQLRSMMDALKEVIVWMQIGRAFMKRIEIEKNLDNMISQIMDDLKSQISSIEKLKNDSDKIVKSIEEGFIKYKDGMIDKDFKKYLSLALIHSFNTIKEYKEKKYKDETLYPNTKPNDFDESNLSNREVRDLIDQALDKRDFEEVKRLTFLLKESVDIVEDDLGIDVFKRISETFISIIIDIFNK